MIGYVAKYFPRDGYGFIKSHSDGQWIFFRDIYITSGRLLEGNRAIGQWLEFEVVESGRKRPEARNITVLNKPPVVNDDTLVGTIEEYDNEEGRGWLTVADGRRVEMLNTSVQRDRDDGRRLKSGVKIRFRLVETRRGLCAREVHILG